jgi:hypothetical protein
VIDVRTQTEVALTGGQIRSHRTLNSRAAGWSSGLANKAGGSPTSRLDTYHELAHRNAALMFQEME